MSDLKICRANILRLCLCWYKLCNERCVDGFTVQMLIKYWHRFMSTDPGLWLGLGLGEIIRCKHRK